MSKGFTFSKALGVGSRTLATYTFKPFNGYLDSVLYGNGFTESYTYDLFGNVSEIKHGDTVVAKNFADSIGNVIRTQDLLTNLEHRISYDYIGRPISKEVLDLSAAYNTDSWIRSVEYSYDVSNNLNKFAYADRYGSNVTSYEYGKDNLLTKTTLDNDKAVTYTYDNLGRLTGKTLDTTSPVNTAYTYHNSARGTVDGKTYTTTKLKTENVAGTTYQYTYDVHGNITKIFSVASDGTKTQIHKYEYDEYGQLTRDMDTVNGVIIDYGYDDSGNINRKKTTAWNSLPDDAELGEEIEDIYYTYGDAEWGDLLTSYGGQTITYDAIGNPLTYRDGISLTWQNGRELATFANSDTSVAYTYDVDGMRTGKTVTSGTTTDTVEYVYEGGLLLQMRYNHMILDFSYDANGSPVSMAYRANTASNPIYYYYALNSRGDVEGLYNSAGTLIAKYSYDAYGKLLSVTNASGTAITAKYVPATLNPLRYRGYVYDTESGLYYLQSRYYDPTICRFINGDSQLNTDSITGFNQFAYCNNNPVMYSDPTGNCPTHTYYYMPSCPGCNPDVAAVHAERGADWAFKRLEKDYGFTHSMSIDVFGIGIGPFSFSVQAGFSTDIEGNLALQVTFTGKIGMPGSDSWNFFGGVNNMISNAPDVSYLEGESHQIGGGVSALIPDTPISIYESRDLNIMESDAGNYYGGSKSKGVGFFADPGIEFHYGMSKTYNLLVIESGGWW